MHKFAYDHYTKTGQRHAVWINLTGSNLHHTEVKKEIEYSLKDISPLIAESYDSYSNLMFRKFDPSNELYIIGIYFYNGDLYHNITHIGEALETTVHVINAKDISVMKGLDSCELMDVSNLMEVLSDDADAIM